MYNFSFHNPTKIFFGKDQLDNIDKNVPQNAKVLITYGGGSAKKSGLIDKVKNALGNREVVEFGGIEPNPKYDTLMEAVQIVRIEKIDFIMAVGGGSVIDGTKFICLAANYERDTLEILQIRRFTPEMIKNVVPFGAVLTLPATGSEMNSGAVISHNNGKFPIGSPMTFPQFSILDPTYTFTLPKIQVANGIVDAFVHTTEQYLTFPVDAKVQDRIAEGILQTLIEIAHTNIDEPENYDARANLVWAATMALNGVIRVGVPEDWSVHMIGHELTALFGIDHGQTLAIILPAMLKIRKNKKREKLLQYANRVWNMTEGTDDEIIDKVIEKTEKFFQSLGIKTKLSEYGVSKDKLPIIVENLKTHGMVALSETRDLTPEISEQILESAF